MTGGVVCGRCDINLLQSEVFCVASMMTDTCCMKCCDLVCGRCNRYVSQEWWCVAGMIKQHMLHKVLSVAGVTDLYLLQFEVLHVAGMTCTRFSLMLLMIAYIVLFSALLSRLTALACGST